MITAHQLPTPTHRVSSLYPLTTGSMVLARRPHAFLNQLLHFDNPTLIVRTPGLSICHETEFGVFYREKDAPVPVFTDPVSGLTIDSREVGGIYIYQPKTGPLSFEIEFPEDGFAIAIQPGNSDHSRMVIARIANSFFGNRVSASTLGSEGAGAWLDEWGHVSGMGSLTKKLDGDLMASCEGRGFSFILNLAVGRQDRDYSTRRIASANKRTFLFAHQSVLQNW